MLEFPPISDQTISQGVSMPFFVAVTSLLSEGLSSFRCTLLVLYDLILHISWESCSESGAHPLISLRSLSGGIGNAHDPLDALTALPRPRGKKLTKERGVLSTFSHRIALAHLRFSCFLVWGEVLALSRAGCYFLLCPPFCHHRRSW